MKGDGRFGALTERDFRLLWLGRTATVFGDSMAPIALTFAIISVGGSAAQIGAVLAATMAVRVLLIVVGGAVADRLPRRRVLIGSDVGLAIVQATTGILLLAGARSVWILAAASILGGAGAAMSRPATTGLVAEAVSPHRLQQANALMGISKSASRVAGPALAGVLIAFAGPGWSYLIGAVTFAVSVACLLPLKIGQQPHRGETGLLRDILDGWHEVRSRRWYWSVLSAHAVWNLGAGAFVVLGPVIVAGSAAGVAGWGLVSASLAVGALLGGVVSLRWQPRRPLVVGHLMLLLTALQLAALLGPSPLPLLAAAAAIGTLGSTFIDKIWTTAIQQLIPRHALSRVSAYDWLISFVAVPAGYAAVGPIAEQIGTDYTLVLAITLVVAPVVVLMLIPEIRRIRQGEDGRMTGVPGADDPAPSRETTAGAAADTGRQPSAPIGATGPGDAS